MQNFEWKRDSSSLQLSKLANWTKNCMIGSKIHHDYPIHLHDLINHTSTSIYTPSGYYRPLVFLCGGINDHVDTLLHISISTKITKKIQSLFSWFEISQTILLGPIQ